MRRKIHIDSNGQPGDGQDPADDAVRTEAQDPQPSGAAVDEESGGVPESDGSKSDLHAEVDSLRHEVEKLTKEFDHERNQHLRALADFQNFRRRREEEGVKDRQFANRELIIALLPVLDNFERALAAAEQSQSYDALIGGVKLTLRQLQEFLKKSGVEPIDAVGLEFDPNLHEAVMRVEDTDAPENTIVEELQRGYTMHDRVVRPSMVKVARST